MHEGSCASLVVKPAIRLGEWSSKIWTSCHCGWVLLATVTTKLQGRGELELKLSSSTCSCSPSHLATRICCFWLLYRVSRPLARSVPLPFRTVFKPLPLPPLEHVHLPLQHTQLVHRRADTLDTPSDLLHDALHVVVHICKLGLRGWIGT